MGTIGSIDGLKTIEYARMASTPDGEAKLRAAYRDTIKEGRFPLMSIEGSALYRLELGGKAILAANSLSSAILDGVVFPFKWFHYNAVVPASNAVESGLSYAYDAAGSLVKKSYEEPAKRMATERELRRNTYKEQTVETNGKRQDGTTRGPGWFGNIDLGDGKFATEASALTNVNGISVTIPLINPLITNEELGVIKRLVRPGEKTLSKKDKKALEGIYEKAHEWAKQRWAEKKSPYIMKGEEFVPLPKDEEGGEKK